MLLQLDCDRYLPLLHSRCDVVSVTLRLVYGRPRTVFNIRLVLFIHRYQIYEAGIGIVWPVHRGCWIAAITIIFMAPAPFPVAKTMMTVHAPLIRRLDYTVRLQVRLLVVEYVCPWTCGSCRAHLLWL